MQVCIDRRYTAERLKVPGRVTVLRSKIRWCASRIKIATRSLLSQKDLIPTKSIRTGFPPACHLICSLILFALLMVLKKHISPGRATRLNMISLIPGVSNPRWKLNLLKACISLVRLMAQRVMRRQVPKACLQESMQR